MKNVVGLLVMLFISFNSTAQEKTYLVFEFMKVENAMEMEYAEVENFWEKIHTERIKKGEIIGWDLWTLLPGGTNQGYQYLTVTIFDDPVKMMEGGKGMWDSAVKAYPDLSEDDLMSHFSATAKSRDLAARVFLVIDDETKSDFKMTPGIVASIDFMKAAEGKYSDYVDMERNLYKPHHQKLIDNNVKKHWVFATVMLPAGSDAYATHITANMYSDFNQLFDAMTFDAGITDEQAGKMEKALETRDMKWMYIAQLLKMAR